VFSDETVITSQRQYCAATEAIDHWVGRILDVVEARGQTDNTYIVFASDHGEMLGDHGLYTKSCPYEAALRVPLIVSGPGIEGGRTSDTPVELIDVNATICDFAGLAPQPGIDAISFRPVLEGTTDTHRTETVSAFRGFRLIRTPDHKLVENANDVDELYDLRSDPDEQNNVAEEHPAVVSRLSARMKERFREGKLRH
jgi:choline-sulfatase